MQDFIKEHNVQITLFLEVLAALVGILCFRKYRSTAAKFLIYFLIYSLLVDIIGGYPKYFRKYDIFHLIEGTLIKQNYWWYTIFWMVGLASFITFFNYKISSKKIYKKVLKYLYIVYLAQFALYAVLNFNALFTPTEKFLKITSIWMILVAVFVYLLEILQSEKVISFYKSIYFYTNISIFMWTIITGPMMFYEIYYSIADSNFIIFKRAIYLSINIIYYLTLTLALIFCKPENK